MPRVVYRHEPADRFIVSAIGEPGQREFFIQVRSAEGINTIGVEKEQVRALIIRLEELVTDLRRSGQISKESGRGNLVIDNDPLELPIENDFDVGVIGINWINNQIEIVFQAISSQDEILLDDFDAGPDQIIIKCEIGLAMAFCTRGKNLIASGRSACPFCGLPINMDGHLCPRANGYRR